MRNKQKYLKLSLTFFTFFAVYTILVSFIDVNAIGPNGSVVGFSILNEFVHKKLGVNLVLYTITDFMGFIPLIIGVFYGIIGLIQWIKRKRITKVDANILALGIFYIATFVVYIIFEFLIINRRPVLIDGYLETSYPSSTTMLALCFMITSIIQTDKYIISNSLKKCLKYLTIIIMLFMVCGRFISGVHWVSDIIGGIIVSIALIYLYYYINEVILDATINLYPTF